MTLPVMREDPSWFFGPSVAAFGLVGFIMATREAPFAAPPLVLPFAFILLKYG